ncbi:hypothetical protein F4803DRAFT_166647 [Xylaria telfairii]|nr:hypothetical protein F4803DRAFT_166647 [Xylaria telfairii]
MRFPIFMLAVLAAPQLTSALPPRPYLAHHPQVAAKAVSPYTPTYATEPRIALSEHKKHPNITLLCKGHGAQCAQFPPNAPRNETFSVRMFCRSVNWRPHHHHHHHPHHHPHHNPPDNTNKTIVYRPLMMYPCPGQRQCRVNVLPPGYKSPPSPDGLDLGPDPDPDSDSGLDSEDEDKVSIDFHKRIQQAAANNAVAILDTLPGTGLENDAHKMPWWNMVFSCVHNGGSNNQSTRIE